MPMTREKVRRPSGPTECTWRMWRNQPLAVERTWGVKRGEEEGGREGGAAYEGDDDF